MAQMQKHWVQAMLNEDTYTPFPYFYDVTAWSQPLLFNVRGGYSGRALKVRARGVRRAGDPGGPAPPADAPRVALFQLSDDSLPPIESTGWLRYLFERVWRLPYDARDDGRRRRPARSSGYDVVSCRTASVPRRRRPRTRRPAGRGRAARLGERRRPLRSAGARAPRSPRSSA